MPAIGVEDGNVINAKMPIILLFESGDIELVVKNGLYDGVGLMSENSPAS